jgi:hypothetical protein
MNRNLPDRSLIREYLLGRLDTKEEEVELQLSQDIVFNDEVAEMVESIEEEIIEDFLDGTLDSADKDAVDRYFLRPPERREKLRFARLLRQHFEERHDFVERRFDAVLPPGVHVMPATLEIRSAVPWWSHFRTYGQLAVLILLSVGGLIYISSIRKYQARLEDQLAREQQHSASLVQEAKLVPSSMVPLTLVSDRSRGGGQIPEIEIKPITQRIIVEIALQSHSTGPFDIHLETTGEKGPTWSAHLLPLISSSGDARLMFDLPVQDLASNVYSFVVLSPLPGAGRPKHYDFRVRLAK